MDETVTLDGDRSVYEVAFLITPNVTEEKLPEAFGTIKSMVLDRGAVAISEEFPKMIPLAYTIERTIDHKTNTYDEAWFGWIKFELDPLAVAALEKEVRNRPEVVRSLLIKTVRENTMAAKRGFGARRRPKSTDKDQESAPTISKEEIDREIEALVDENVAE